MKIKMLQDAPGSPDGAQVLQYDAGVEYDVPDELGEVLVREQLAEPVKPAAAAKPSAKPAAAKATKNKGAQPENKQE